MDINLKEVIPDIGEEAAQILKEKYPGYRIYVDKKKMNFDSQEKKEQYIKNLAFSSAWSPQRIADHMELSAEYVYKIINKRQ